METAGTEQWSETINVSFTNGYYAAILGSDEINNPLDSDVLQSYPLFIEFQLNSNAPMIPRQPIHSAPYAQIAGIAESIDGGTVNTPELKINGSTVIDSQQNWTGNPIDVNWKDINQSTIPSDILDGDENTQLDEATVESYITNDVIDLKEGSSAGGQLLVTAPPTCTDQQILSFDATAQSWKCVSMNVPSCSNGQIQTYQSSTSSWICSDFSAVIDQDCDGSLAWNDCDDSDASIGNQSTDADCDGVLTSLDCDDSDATSTTVATDYDCDGVLTSADCDDTNPLVGTSGTGSSVSCAALSCLEILSNNASVGDSAYWIDPLSTGSPFQVDCIMTSDGGGWIALSPNTNQHIYMGQDSTSNPWRKCGDDSAKHYSWISEGSVSADHTSSSVIHTGVLSYTQPSTGAVYSATQVSAMRTAITELSSTTRLVAVTADDDGYSYQDGDPSGHEVYLGNESGSYTVMTPGTNGECGGSSGWGQSQAGHYLWASTASDSEVDGVTGMSSSQLGALSSSFLIPYDYQLAIYSGGGASFGWENEEFWVR